MVIGLNTKSREFRDLIKKVSAGGGSRTHTVARQILSLVRLPVSPRPHITIYFKERLFQNGMRRYIYFNLIRKSYLYGNKRNYCSLG